MRRLLGIVLIIDAALVMLPTYRWIPIPPWIGVCLTCGGIALASYLTFDDLKRRNETKRN